MANPIEHETAAPKRRLLKPTAAAEYMDNTVDAGTLAKWRMLGRGPSFIRLGNRIFYEESALDAYLESCRVEPGTAA
jgi:hypothetical protein